MKFKCLNILGRDKSGNGDYHFNPFFIVLARTLQNVDAKILELENMKVSYVIVCGEQTDHPNVVFRSIAGKWDAINFGASFVPKEVNVIVLNDVDTVIHGFKDAFKYLTIGNDLIYCRVNVSVGPQVKFYRILNPLEKEVPLSCQWNEESYAD